MRFVPLFVVLLSGCTVMAEYPVTTAGMAIWGATGKAPADHALSAVANKDCATIRVIEGEDICQEYHEVTVADVTINKSVISTTKNSTAIATANDVFAQRASRKKNEKKNSTKR